MLKTAYNITQLDFIHDGYKGSKVAKIPTTTKMSKKVTVSHQPIRQYPYFVYIPKMGGSFSCKDLNEVNNILNKYLL